MHEKSGLLIIDLQYGYSPSLESIENIRDTAEEYPVIVATRFLPNRDNASRHGLDLPPIDGGAVIDVGHNLVIERPGYGLNQQALDTLREFSEITEWGLIGGRTGVCLLACAFSLWDAGIPFHVVRPFCFASPGPSCQAVDTLLQQHFGV
ncbi:hypothetical protein ACJU26_11725 [Acidithiobacillus sp. M4-SHS-6]|uniref:hypothetical protein n=1 Tax=Acidithiobacillus sp. M4-SHS-6 TaxID=3383024 RepID=UPI0039BE3A5F